MRITQALQRLALTLPTLRAPVASYVASVRSGNLLYISGQISESNGQPAFQGRLGAELNTQDGQQAARLAALNLIAQIDAAVDGDIRRVKRVLRLGVFIASAPSFTEHSSVANGASDLITAVFGAPGQHARTSVGVAALPLGVCVELDAVVELRDVYDVAPSDAG